MSQPSPDSAPEPARPAGTGADAPHADAPDTSAPAAADDAAKHLLGLGPRLKDLLQGLDLAPDDTSPDTPPDPPPPRLARYRILRLIGEGGMGSVYEAEQQTPRRRVALKVIKPGMDTRQVPSSTPPRGHWVATA